MTTLGKTSHPSDGVQALVTRLRAAAGQMTAFSETKLLLREAASMIERLHRERGEPAERVRPPLHASADPTALR